MQCVDCFKRPFVLHISERHSFWEMFKALIWRRRAAKELERGSPPIQPHIKVKIADFWTGFNFIENNRFLHWTGAKDAKIVPGFFVRIIFWLEPARDVAPFAGFISSLIPAEPLILKSWLASLMKNSSAAFSNLMQFSHSHKCELAHIHRIPDQYCEREKVWCSCSGGNWGHYKRKLSSCRGDEYLKSAITFPLPANFNTILASVSVPTLG